MSYIALQLFLSSKTLNTYQARFLTYDLFSELNNCINCTVQNVDYVNLEGKNGDKFALTGENVETRTVNLKWQNGDNVNFTGQNGDRFNFTAQIGENVKNITGQNRDWPIILIYECLFCFQDVPSQNANVLQRTKDYWQTA